MATKLYTQTRVIVSFGGKSHATDGHGRLLCAPKKIVNSQSTLDLEPTCGWCKLLLSEASSG